jgi:hypothetical protein
VKPRQAGSVCRVWQKIDVLWPHGHHCALVDQKDALVHAKLPEELSCPRPSSVCCETTGLDAEQENPLGQAMLAV